MQYYRGTGKLGCVFSMLITALVITSCLNPVGLPFNTNISGEIDVNIKPPGSDDIFGKGEAAYPLVIKNLTKSVDIIEVVFVKGTETAIVTEKIARSTEWMGRLPQGNLKITLRYTDTRVTPPVTNQIEITKAILPKMYGAANYLYFYRHRDGHITVDTDDTGKYVDPDPDDTGSTTLPGAENNPGEGSNINEDKEVTITDPALRDLYGVLKVHNLSKTATVKRVTFTQGTKTFTLGTIRPGGTHFRAIVLEKGVWNVSLEYQAGGTSATLTGTKTIAPAGVWGYVNHLYFYKGKPNYAMSGDTDDEPDPNIVDENEGGSTGGGTELNPGEGSLVNEDKEIAITDPGVYAHYGILQVHNLSRTANITGVTFVKGPKTFGGVDFGIRSGGTHFRSIVLEKGVWNITLTYQIIATSAVHTITTTKTVKEAGIYGFVNHIYFYKGKIPPLTEPGYAVTENNDDPPNPNDMDPSDGAGAGGGSPGEEEGSSPGSITDRNRDRFGLVIVKNLTREIDMNFATFTQPAGTPLKTFLMNPGPRASDQKSILLGVEHGSDWRVTTNYTKEGVARTTDAKTITIETGKVSYVYFYLTTSGACGISPTWPPYPNNAAQDNADPGSIIGDDEGWLHIKNSSQVGSIVDRIQYQNAAGVWVDLTIPGPNGSAGAIGPGGESDPDVVVPRGIWNFHFKIVGKMSYGASVQKTIRVGDKTTIEYMDSLENTINIPAGAGLIRIRNYSDYTVQSLKIYTRVGQEMYHIPYAQFEPPNPIGKNETGERVIMDVPGGPGPQPPAEQFVIQLIMERNGLKKSVDYIRSLYNQIVQLEVTGEDVGDGGTTEISPEYDGGILVVSNAYMGPYPMRIFKIFLKQQGVIKYAYTNVNVPLEKGQTKQFDNVEEGTYSLEIVAGIYTWNVYSDGGSASITGGVQLTEQTITYQCGNIFVPEGYRKFYYFNVSTGQEKDMAGRMPVNIQVSFSQGSTSINRTITYFEVVIPPSTYTYNVQHSGAGYSNGTRTMDLWNTRNIAVSARVDTESLHFVSGYDNNAYNAFSSTGSGKMWPGPEWAWTGYPSKNGAATPQAYILYRNGTTLSAAGTNSYSFLLPPGKYWMRARNSQTQWNGYWEYGNSESSQNPDVTHVGYRWAIVDTSSLDGAQIYISVDPGHGITYHGLPTSAAASGRLKPNGSEVSSGITNANLRVYETADFTGDTLNVNANPLPYSFTCDAKGAYTVRSIEEGPSYRIVGEFNYQNKRYRGVSAPFQGLTVATNNLHIVGSPGTFTITGGRLAPGGSTVTSGITGTVIKAYDANDFFGDQLQTGADPLPNVSVTMTTSSGSSHGKFIIDYLPVNKPLRLVAEFMYSNGSYRAISPVLNHATNQTIGDLTGTQYLYAIGVRPGYYYPDNPATPQYSYPAYMENKIIRVYNADTGAPVSGQEKAITAFSSSTDTLFTGLKPGNYKVRLTFTYINSGTAGRNGPYAGEILVTLGGGGNVLGRSLMATHE
ncbi:MAG: hypothetical protein LBC88_08450 [Spirochaetaceae bacterium]|jgi:hypothetical protein|nr:hypothetical protein [Spirochaetaceae bacterium]